MPFTQNSAGETRISEVDGSQDSSSELYLPELISTTAQIPREDTRMQPTKNKVKQTLTASFW